MPYSIQLFPYPVAANGHLRGSIGRLRAAGAGEEHLGDMKIFESPASYIQHNSGMLNNRYSIFFSFVYSVLVYCLVLVSVSLALSLSLQFFAFLSRKNVTCCTRRSLFYRYDTVSLHSDWDPWYSNICNRLVWEKLSDHAFDCGILEYHFKFSACHGRTRRISELHHSGFNLSLLQTDFHLYIYFAQPNVFSVSSITL